MDPSHTFDGLLHSPLYVQLLAALIIVAPIGAIRMFLHAQTRQVFEVKWLIFGFALSLVPLLSACGLVTFGLYGLQRFFGDFTGLKGFKIGPGFDDFRLIMFLASFASVCSMGVGLWTLSKLAKNRLEPAFGNDAGRTTTEQSSAGAS